MACLYVVVEGERTEMSLYPRWFKQILPSYTRIARIEDAQKDSFYLVAGYGYPSYKKRIRSAMSDIQMSNGAFSHLLVCADSEEISLAEREAEIVEEFEGAGATCDTIIAECCIESWLLGNQSVVSRNPQSDELRKLLSIYDVSKEDPERMPNPGTESTRARFHTHYLREVLKEKGLSYSKGNTRSVESDRYFEMLVCRTRQTPGHLKSFSKLLRLPDWVK